MKNDTSNISDEQKKILFAKLTKLFVLNLDDNDKNMAFIFNDIRPKLITLMDSINNSYNEQYSSMIHGLSGNNSLIKKVFRYYQYDDIKKDLTPESIILYFKEANLFAIYEGDDVYNFINTEMMYPMFQNKNIYEFVPEDRPQKIVIIKNDHGDDEFNNKCIIKLKNYLYKYIKESFKENSKNIKSKDIIIRKNSCWVELLIHNLSVQNQFIKNQFIDDFKNYVSKSEGNRDLETSVFNYAKLDMFGVCGNFYNLPKNIRLDVNGQKLASSSQNYPMVSMNLKEIPNIKLNVNIINGDKNIINTNIGDYNSTSVTKKLINKPKKVGMVEKAYQLFLKSLIDNPPLWYDPGEYADCRVIYNYFTENFCKNIENIYIVKFSRDMKNRLYDETLQKRENKSTITYYKLI
jgi:hypothetical protein